MGRRGENEIGEENVSWGHKYIWFVQKNALSHPYFFIYKQQDILSCFLLIPQISLHC